MKTSDLIELETEERVVVRPGLQPARTLFAAGMIGLGVLALVYGDFAMVWQPVATWVPGRTALAYGSGVLMLVCGAGLLFRASARWAVRVLFPYLIVWALLKVPALMMGPQHEGNWLGLGELTVLLSGGWVLFARLSGLPPQGRGPVPGDPGLPPQGRGPVLGDPGVRWRVVTGDRGVRWATILFGVSLVPIGLSHFVYAKETFGLVPPWLPFRGIWVYVTGVGHIAAGVGVLVRVLPGVAATAEACMISLFTLLCWLPMVVTTPKVRLGWTAFFISWAIASAAWVVAARGPGTRE